MNLDVMDAKFLMLGVKGVSLCYPALKMYVFYQVIPEGANRALYSPHSFKINFKEGGTGTFIPLFMNLIKSVRAAQRMVDEPQSQPSAPPIDPMPAAPAPVDEMMRHA